MSSYRIAVLKGDGIGPEITTATLIVLDALAKRFPDLSLQHTTYEAGAELYRKTGTAIPANVLEACVSADAVLLSAIGLPDVRKPDGTEVQPEMMVGLRRAMGVYAAVRPIKLYPNVPTPLKGPPHAIDFIIIRENLEGLFASFNGGSQVGDEVATDTIVITRKGTQQVVDYAFRLAKRRTGRPMDSKQIVTCVDKANVFRSFAFFRKVFFDVAAQYPEIHADATYVDAMSLYMVQHPWMFDVMVMENQFGDILSDLGAAIVGGLGLGPSAELSQDRGLFQPSHGTAPQLTGLNVANPLAMILSAQMMLDWLSDKHSDEHAGQAAIALESAVVRLLAEGKVRTKDIGGNSSTNDVAHEVARLLLL